MRWTPLYLISGFLAAACGQGPWRRADGASEAPGRDPYELVGHQCASAAETAALAALTAARVAAGAPPLACLAGLSAMAEAHARFLAANGGGGRDPHAEAPGRPGYTGATLAQRAAAAGLDRRAFWLAEGVGGAGTPAAVVAAHLGSVYHRSQLLTPGARYFGFAVAAGAAGRAVLESLALSGAAGLDPARFPGPDAAEVPVAFDPGGESPDPLAGRTAAAGYPVSVHFPRLLAADDRQAVRVRSFSLTDAAGAGVPALLLTAATDPSLVPSDVFLVPTSPLAPASRYTVAADLDLGGAAWRGRWSFTTAPRP